MKYTLSLTFNGQEMLKENMFNTMSSAMEQAEDIVSITTLHNISCALSLHTQSWIKYLKTVEWKETGTELALAADYTPTGNAILWVKFTK